MKKNQRKPQHSRPDPDVHLLFGDVADRGMAQLSIQIDAATDREWFRQHPDAQEFERPATVREVAATGHPPGTRVRVVRGQLGSQFRVFLLPKRRGFFDDVIGGPN
ncbi:MAG TPA: hypothetical protein VHV55_05345 [Pirellulales bacterium]|jgi:hypothetical protein|nr:hypothetical protein [Pirellulales bacterium]